MSCKTRNEVIDLIVVRLSSLRVLVALLMLRRRDVREVLIELLSTDVAVVVLLLRLRDDDSLIWLTGVLIVVLNTLLQTLKLLLTLLDLVLWEASPLNCFNVLNYQWTGNGNLLGIVTEELKEQFIYSFSRAC